MDAHGLRWQVKYEVVSSTLAKEYNQKTKSFGFGPRKGVSRKDAFEAALNWIWAKHTAVTKEVRSPTAVFESISPEMWGGVFDVAVPEMPYEGRRVRRRTDG